MCAFRRKWSGRAVEKSKTIQLSTNSTKSVCWGKSGVCGKLRKRNYISCRSCVFLEESDLVGQLRKAKLYNFPQTVLKVFVGEKVAYVGNWENETTFLVEVVCF